MDHLELVSLIVEDYDEAITFFVDVLGFELIEDTPSLANDGRQKRWVVVRPGAAGGPGAPGSHGESRTCLLLAQADGPRQKEAVGQQMAGRVGFFLRVANFDASYQRMVEAGVSFRGEPRDEPYGRVVVFNDVAGNPWDMLGPRPSVTASEGSVRPQ
jgi:catechol 2,3-dioxygenase-like lactoylglutathione lyase family enzyme